MRWWDGDKSNREGEEDEDEKSKVELNPLGKACEYTDKKEGPNGTNRVNIVKW